MFLRLHCTPGTTLYGRESAINQIEYVPAFIEVTFQWRDMKKLAKPLSLMLSWTFNSNCKTSKIKSKAPKNDINSYGMI